MATTVTIDLRQVGRGLDIPLRQIQAAVELLDEGNTVPFITRYRKDQTGGLDEEQIREIQDRLTKSRLLADRKQTILRSIDSQGKLTEKLAKQVLSATTTKRLEDLYLPYKPKKQTLATLARSRGLEQLAAEILEAARRVPTWMHGRPTSPTRTARCLPRPMPCSARVTSWPSSSANRPNCANDCARCCSRRDCWSLVDCRWSQSRTPAVRQGPWKSRNRRWKRRPARRRDYRPGCRNAARDRQSGDQSGARGFRR